MGISSKRANSPDAPESVSPFRVRRFVSLLWCGSYTTGISTFMEEQTGPPEVAPVVSFASQAHALPWLRESTVRDAWNAVSDFVVNCASEFVCLTCIVGSFCVCGACVACFGWQLRPFRRKQPFRSSHLQCLVTGVAP